MSDASPVQAPGPGRRGAAAASSRSRRAGAGGARRRGTRFARVIYLAVLAFCTSSSCTRSSGPSARR